MAGTPARTEPELRQEYEDVIDFCELVSMGRNEFDMAIELRATHGLKALDAMHMAAAVANDCQEFCTSDRKLANVRKVGETTIRQLRPEPDPS